MKQFLARDVLLCDPEEPADEREFFCLKILRNQPQTSKAMKKFVFRLFSTDNRKFSVFISINLPCLRPIVRY